jgi:hypothetical protein
VVGSEILARTAVASQGPASRSRSGSAASCARFRLCHVPRTSSSRWRYQHHHVGGFDPDARGVSSSEIVTSCHPRGYPVLVEWLNGTEVTGVWLIPEQSSRVRDPHSKNFSGPIELSVRAVIVDTTDPIADGVVAVFKAGGPDGQRPVADSVLFPTETVVSQGKNLFLLVLPRTKPRALGATGRHHGAGNNDSSETISRTLEIPANGLGLTPAGTLRACLRRGTIAELARLWLSSMNVANVHHHKAPSSQVPLQGPRPADPRRA